jgi:hypothetical protein
MQWGGPVGAQVPGTAKMRKGYPRDYPYGSGGCTCPACTGYYGGKTTTTHKDDYTSGTDNSNYDKYPYDKYYRGSTDSNYSKSEMTEFQKRLQESMQEIQREDKAYQRERERRLEKQMRESSEKIKKTAKLEEEFKRLVEGMLEGINAKEASGTISSEEAEKLVEMVVNRVDGADVIAGLPKKKEDSATYKYKDYDYEFPSPKY